MKFGSSSFEDYVKFRKRNNPGAPALPPALLLAILLGIACAVTMAITDWQQKSESAHLNSKSAPLIQVKKPESP